MLATGTVPRSREKRCRFLHRSGTSSFRAVVRSSTLLGQVPMPQRRLLPFAAVALIVLAAPTLGLAGSGSGSTPSAGELQARNADLASKSRSAVLQLYSLDHRLTSARASLAELRSQAAALRAEQATLEEGLAVARRG